MREFEENVEENVMRPARWSPWLAAIAAARRIAIVIPVVRTLHRSPIERLAALSPKDARIIEPRLTGGFAWSPYRGSERAPAMRTADPARMKLAGEAGDWSSAPNTTGAPKRSTTPASR